MDFRRRVTGFWDRLSGHRCLKFRNSIMKRVDLRARLSGWSGPLDGEALQSEVFAVGKAHEFEPLRNWFTALYEVLLGASQGPRFGGFIALYGVEETIALIDKALAGELS